MTEAQATVYQFIRDRMAATGVCPSLTEIAGAMGVKSKSNAYRVIDALVRDGHIVRGVRGTNRSLRLPREALTHVPTSALIAELERRGVRLG